MSFSIVTVSVIALRSSALALVLAGRTTEADRLYALAELIEAGQVADEHMRLVAEKLKSREITDADWDELFARIDAARDKLHEDLPPPA